MAIQVQSGSDPQWWSVIVAGVGVALSVLGARFSRVRDDSKEAATRSTEIGVLKTKTETNERNIEKASDAIAALADSHRVAWEKMQQQYWDLRAKVAELPTATQIHNTKDEIIAEIRGHHRD